MQIVDTCVETEVRMQIEQLQTRLRDLLLKRREISPEGAAHVAGEARLSLVEQQIAELRRHLRQLRGQLG